MELGQHAEIHIFHFPLSATGLESTAWCFVKSCFNTGWEHTSSSIPAASTLYSGEEPVKPGDRRGS